MGQIGSSNRSIGASRFTGQVSRRGALLGGAAIALGSGTWPGVAQAAADPVAFLALSRAATGHSDLSPVTSGRIFAAMAARDGQFAAAAARLAALIQPGQVPEALLNAASAAGLRETMLAIVAAWYTGTVGHGTDAQLVAYQQALMYRPCADGLVVPTYCSDGPAWWVAPPPAAGVGPASGPALAMPETVPATTSKAP